MTLELTRHEVGHLVHQTGAVVERSGAAHPILSYVLIKPATHGCTFRAASASAHVATIAGEGDLGLAPVAIRQEHLARLYGLIPDRGQLQLASPDAGTVTVTLTLGDATIGTWKVPVASAAETAYFPDEPAHESSDEPTVYSIRAMAHALAAIAWVTTDDGSVQIIDNNTVLANTWAAAHMVSMPDRPLDDALVVVPGKAARILRTCLAKLDGRTIRWDETDSHHHVRSADGSYRIHLAKWSGAVENVRARFFRPPATDETRVSGPALARVVLRASALHAVVSITVDAGQLVVRAEDHSSTQATEARNAPDWAQPVTLDAGQLSSALAAFPEWVDLAPEAGATLILRDPDGSQAVALVPLVAPT